MHNEGCCLMITKNQLLCLYSCKFHVCSFVCLFFWYPAAPYWISSPRNLVLAPKEHGMLKCLASGSPKPTITWFMNGVPIES